MSRKHPRPTLPSSQLEVLFANTQPVLGLQESSVHALSSSQLPVIGRWEQNPVLGSQLSLVQGLASLPSEPIRTFTLYL